MKAVFSLLQDLDLEVATLKGGCFLGVVNVRSSVTYLGHSDSSEILQEITIGLETNPIVLIFYIT